MLAADGTPGPSALRAATQVADALAGDIEVAYVDVHAKLTDQPAR